MKYLKVCFLLVIGILPLFVFAEDHCDSSNIVIDSISLKEKSETAEELSDVEVVGHNIQLDLKMMNLDDYVEYELNVKNQSDEDVYFDETSLSTDNAYLQYQISYPDASNIIPAKTDKDILLRVSYVKAVEDFHYANQENIAIPLSNKEIVKDKESVKEILQNPKTFYNIFYVVVMVSLFVLYVIFSRRKSKVFLFIIVGIGSIPFVVQGICKTEMVIDSKVELYNTTKSISFAEDSWETISEIAKMGNACDYYQVGDTKMVSLTEYGEHPVRIANCSRPVECDNENFSQTACGFVLEFTDGIVRTVMNSSHSGDVIGTGNYGGYEASELYSFLKNDLFRAFPEDLQKVIIDTKVVTGHGSKDTNNSVTTDKLYLLSLLETHNVNHYDTAAHLTRQLDYYREVGVNSYNYDGATKYLNGSSIPIWLRVPHANSIYNFQYSWGYISSQLSDNSFYVSPAFRIGA